MTADKAILIAKVRTVAMMIESIAKKAATTATGKAYAVLAAKRRIARTVLRNIEFFIQWLKAKSAVVNGDLRNAPNSKSADLFLF